MSGSARSRLVTHLTRAVGAAGVVTVLGVAPALIGPGPAAASALRTSRVSVTATGAQSSGSSIGSALSGDGRFAGFTSSAPDLVPDPSTWSEALVRDRRRGTTTVVSVSSTGAPGDFWDGSPAISVTGRYVAFDADSTNLVPGDGNGLRDVFVRDTGARTTERVSVSSSGAESVTGESMAASISADGRFVVFSSSATDLVPGAPPAGTYRHDRTTGVTTAVAENASGQPVASGAGSISPSGRYVAFESPAADIVTGDTNGTGDVFVRDYVTGTTVRATVAGDGTQLSAGGYGVGTTSVSDTGVVAFVSTDSALAPGGVSQVYVRDLRAGTTRLVSRSAAGTPGDVYSTDPPRQPRRPLRGVLRRGRQPGAGGRERPRVGRLPERPAHRAPDPGEPVQPGRAGRRGERQPEHLRRRPARRVQLLRHQPGAARHQRRRGHVRHRPVVVVSASDGAAESIDHTG
jgi:Tol biopolymer transport system component